jgi:hypothetical protein
MTRSVLLKQTRNDNHLCIPYAEVAMTKPSRLATMDYILTHSSNEVVSKRKFGVHTAAPRQILRSPELFMGGESFPWVRLTGPWSWWLASIYSRYLVPNHAQERKGFFVIIFTVSVTDSIINSTKEQGAWKLAFHFVHSISPPLPLYTVKSNSKPALPWMKCTHISAELN